jgi:ABC-type glycerol-3-phosphate transport system substrate-binding protein
MKKTGKVLSLAMASACVFSMAACNNNKIDNEVPDETNLDVTILSRGYGTSWLEDALVPAFEAKTGADVHVTVVYDTAQITNEMALGKKKNGTDLYFTLEETVFSLLDTYRSDVMNLTDIYNETLPNESKTLGDKMLDTVKDMITVEENGIDNYYCIPWATGVMGLVYNNQVIEGALGAGYQLPRTTAELENFAGDLKEKEVTPFVYPGALDQFSGNLVYSWWAQYEGMEVYDYFFQGKIKDTISGEYIYSKDIMEQQGRLEALSVLESLLKPDKGWFDKTYLSYNDSNFTTIQKRFLADQAKGEGFKYAMYPCGDWLEQESKNDNCTSDFKMMKTPVISSIVKTLEDKSMTDETLCQIIDQVDAGATESTLCSESDFARIKEARNITYSKAAEHIAYAPSYCNAQKLVKDFLQFMASDEGIKLYKENVGGGFLPFEYDYTEMKTNMSTFEKSLADMISLNLISKTNKSALFSRGNVKSMIYTNGSIDQYLGQGQASAQDIFDDMKYNESDWSKAMQLAGLSE